MKNVPELSILLTNPNVFADWLLEVLPEKTQAVGLRGLHRDQISLGPCDASYDWVDGNRSDTQLKGTSTVGLTSNFYYDSYENIIRTIERHANEIECYTSFSKAVGLITGGYGVAGEDPGEIIIPKASVIHIWRNFG